MKKDRLQSTQVWKTRSLFFIVFIIAIIAFAGPLYASLRFGILADTRCGELPPDWNETGVNTAAVNAIAREMLNDNVDLVLANGDLIHGQFFPFDWTPVTEMYTAWTNAMGPVHSAGVPIYPVPGNHEYYCGTFHVHTNETGPRAMVAWSNFFGELPKNGPSNRLGRTYGFSFSNAFFMGFDQYEVEGDESYLLNTNFTCEVQNQWVSEQLASNSLRHIFVFGHFPAFTLVTDFEEFCGGGSLELGGLAQRQAFWDGIGVAGCRVYFGSHQHFYARSTASISNGPTLQHVVIGNSGAPHEDWDGSYAENGQHGVTILPEYHEGNEHVYGYILVEVDELTVTVTYRASLDLITWTNRDSFSYTLVPLSPGLVAPSGIGTNEFTTHWRPSVGATYYLLDVSASNTFSTYVDEYHNLLVPGMDQTVTGLHTGTRYYYRVRAADIGGTSDYSSIGTVWTEPSVPHALPATHMITNAFTANWISAEGATNYLLYAATDIGFNNPLPGYNPLGVGITTSYSVTGLTAGTDYFYRLKAQNAGGTTTNSHTISVWTVPREPDALAATDVTEDSFYANWVASPGATNYFLDVSKTNTFSNFIIGNLRVGTALTWHVGNLSLGHTYYYRIRASNAGGTSANSDTIEVVLIPEPCAVLFVMGLMGVVCRHLNAA